MVVFSSAEVNVFRSDQRFFVPHSLPWPRQIQVILGPGPKMVVDLAPVHLHHCAVQIDDRNHQRTHEVLMPGTFAEDAQFLQASALARTLDAVLIRQVVIQRAIGKTEPEALDHLRRFQAALDEVLLRSRRLLQRPVVVIHHDAQQFLIVHARLEQRRQFRHGRDFWRRFGCAGRGRQIVPLQQFHRVREADALGPHHPSDHVTAFAARAFAVPDVLHGIDVEAGISVLVEGTQSDQFFAAAS
jgi:hypothetical protein